MMEVEIGEMSDTCSHYPSILTVATACWNPSLPCHFQHPFHHSTFTKKTNYCISLKKLRAVYEKQKWKNGVVACGKEETLRHEDAPTLGIWIWRSRIGFGHPNCTVSRFLRIPAWLTEGGGARTTRVSVPRIQLIIRFRCWFEYKKIFFEDSTEKCKAAATHTWWLFSSMDKIQKSDQ